LPWFVEALRLDQGNQAREGIHRMRIATTLQECPKLTQLWSHQGPVTWAEFSRDGRRVVTASSDHTARVWDAETGAPVTGPLRHAGPVASSRFSPNGHFVVTASDDHAAQVWDAATGRPVAPPLKHRDRVP